MFGHQDDKPDKQDGDAIPDESIQGALNEDDGQATASTATVTLADPSATDSTDTPSGSPAPSTDGQPWQHPGTPLNSSKEPIKDVISPVGGIPKKPTFQYPVPSISSADTFTPPKSESGDAATQELIGIKKKAVDELSPIIDKLDMPPEAKFRTIMMMIQSTDNQALVKAAYTAAHSIEDEKDRAQALLDIINEVNYFTQPNSDDDQPQIDQ
jgi:hypothetical protein